MKNNIRMLRKKRGLTQVRVAQMIGTSRGMFIGLENGEKKLYEHWLEKISIALECRPQDIIADSQPRLVKVIGKVGAGSEIYSFDDHQQGAALEEVEAPFGLPHDIIAVVVHGESQLPMLRNNWLLFYRKHQDGVPPDCINNICVIKLNNERMLVKEVKQGSKPHLFHLLSHNAEPMFDQQLEWAARVLDIRPR